MSLITITVSGVLYRSCPWCGLRRRRSGCECLPGGVGSPQTRNLAGLDLTVALHEYGPVVRRFVLAAKNGGRRDLLSRFGRQMATILPPESAPSATITWVPASRQGRRRRGYDQARLLARALGRATRRPVRPLLARADNSGQAGQGRSGRLSGPNIRCRLNHCPAEVILVDDVVTTGASLSIAAEALRQAGAARIIGLCVASADTEYGTKVASPSNRFDLW